MGFDMREYNKVKAAKKATVAAIPGRSAKLDAINFNADHLPDCMKQDLKKQCGV